MRRRLALADRFAGRPDLQEVARRHCRADVGAWIGDWCWTYDPRLAGSGQSPYVPFDLFPRQEAYLAFLEERLARREEGLVEKSRDVGATWLNAAFALHRWLFHPGVKTTFGSRKQDQVDRIGDPDSIFEKMRIMLRRLPGWMLPAGFSFQAHDLHLRLVNPGNGNIITGEAGDNMGRGGRATLYLIDEAAHLERADRIEAAIIGTAETRIWVSSVNGQGNMFARKRFSGRIPVFRFHWRDDPRKDEAWAARKRQATDPAIWAAEYEIDYAASVEGICIPAAWVEAAVRLSGRLALEPVRSVVAGLDVGGGKAASVFIAKAGPLVLSPVVWNAPDTIDTAHKALDAARSAGVSLLNYDAVGIGAGVTAALKRAATGGLRVRAVNVGAPPGDTRWPDGRSARDLFANLKAELWWRMRGAFQRAHEHLAFLEGREGGAEHAPADLVILPGHGDLAAELSLPRWFRTETGRIILETKDQLRARGIKSPDHADALALAFAHDEAPRVTSEEFLV